MDLGARWFNERNFERPSEGRGFKVCVKTLLFVSFRGAAGDEESRTALKTSRARSFAALRMTAKGSE
jgi:hypothetical protein